MNGTKVFDSFVALDKIVSEFNGAFGHMHLAGYMSDSSDGGGVASGGVSGAGGGAIFGGTLPVSILDERKEAMSTSKTKAHRDHKHHKKGFYGHGMTKNCIFELDSIFAQTRKTIESHYSRQVDDVELSIMDKHDSLELVDDKIEYIVTLCVRNYNRAHSSLSPDKHFAAPMLSAQFDTKNQTFAAQLTSYFENLNNEFISGIKENNVLKLKQFFDRMIAFGNDKSAVLLKKLKQLDKLDLNNLRTYKQRIHECIEYLDAIRKKIELKGINNEETKTNDNEGIHYYAFLKTKMNFLSDVCKIEDHLKVDTKVRFFEPCVLSIQRDIKIFLNDIDDGVRKTKEDPENDACWQKINIGYKNLVAFESLELVNCKIDASSINAKHEYNTNVKSIRDITYDMKMVISTRLTEIINDTYKNRHKIDTLAKNLIIHSIACTSLPSFSKVMQSSMQHTIDKLQSEKPQLIVHLAVRLDQINPTWADSVKKSHRAFEDCASNHMEYEELEKKHSDKVSNGTEFKSDEIEQLLVKFANKHQKIKNPYVLAIGIEKYNDTAKLRGYSSLRGVKHDVSKMIHLWNEIYGYDNIGIVFAPNVTSLHDCDTDSDTDTVGNNSNNCNVIEKLDEYMGQEHTYSAGDEILCDRQKFSDNLIRIRGIINQNFKIDGLIFYYSGHGIDNKIILSNGHSFPIREILSLYSY